MYVVVKNGMPQMSLVSSFKVNSGLAQWLTMSAYFQK